MIIIFGNSSPTLNMSEITPVHLELWLVDWGGNSQVSRKVNVRKLHTCAWLSYFHVGAFELFLFSFSFWDTITSPSLLPIDGISPLACQYNLHNFCYICFRVCKADDDNHLNYRNFPVESAIKIMDFMRQTRKAGRTEYGMNYFHEIQALE